MSNDPFSENPNSPNPYSPTVSGGAAEPALLGDLTPAEMKKVEAITKDAGQFWLAILLCFLCGALGPIIIGPWYLVRLVQWNGMSSAHPWLLDQTAPAGSLQKKFQSSKWKLIVGLVFGALVLVGIVVLIAGISVAGPAPAN